MVKDYWDRDANGSIASRFYARAHTVPAVGAGGAGIGLMLFYAQDPAQAERINSDGLDAAERLSLYLPAERARALAATILEALKQAEEMQRDKN